MKYETVSIPFMTIGNRRALTGIQLMERPELRDFVERFPASFEYSPNLDMVFFIEVETDD